MRRRNFNAALAIAAVAWPFAARANTLPSSVLSELPMLQRWGTGEFSRFGFFVYEATLWAASSERVSPPLALSLTYKRSIQGQAIAEASADQMRDLGAKEPDLSRWLAQMQTVFPNVKDGDQIVGVQLPDKAAFYFNGQPIGEVPGAEFARTFFGIWLDPRTSEPRLRTALLKRAD